MQRVPDAYGIGPAVGWGGSRAQRAAQRVTVKDRRVRPSYTSQQDQADNGHPPVPTRKNIHKLIRLHTVFSH